MHYSFSSHIIIIISTEVKELVFFCMCVSGCELDWNDSGSHYTVMSAVDKSSAGNRNFRGKAFNTSGTIPLFLANTETVVTAIATAPIREPEIEDCRREYLKSLTLLLFVAYDSYTYLFILFCFFC